MPISFGSANIGAVYAGSTPISEVHDGSTLVWQNGPSWTGETVLIPAQTPSTSSGTLVGSAITVPENVTGQARLRVEVKWANRASGQPYRIRLYCNGSAMTSWEFAPGGSGAYTQILERGYGTNPYPFTTSLAPGDVYEVGVWVAAPNASNRAINQSTFTIESV